MWCGGYVVMDGVCSGFECYCAPVYYYLPTYLLTYVLGYGGIYVCR